MGKREKLKEFHRSNILGIARKLFVDKGVIGTTMEDIAKEGQYSKSTLYAYFTSKDEIYGSLVLESILLLKESIESAMKENDTLEGAYMSICQAHVDFQQRYPLYFETMIGSITENDEKENKINQSITNVGEEINHIIIDFLEKWKEKGRVKANINTLQTAFTLWAGICGLIIMAHNKASYIKCMNVDKQDFLEYGFRTFLSSIIIEENK